MMFSLPAAARRPVFARVTRDSFRKHLAPVGDGCVVTDAAIV
jgi:hypothetical protein